MAEGSGYNPYRKANGEFASAAEVGSVEDKVSADLEAARESGDADRLAQVEEYAMNKLPDTKLGRRLLENSYGSTTSVSKSVSTEDRYEGLREAYRASTPPGDFSNQAQIDLGHKLKDLSDSEFHQLAAHNLEQLNSGRRGSAWDEGIKGGVQIEWRRRFEAEKFAELEKKGYEYDGLGKYVSRDRKSVYFVAASGINKGRLVLRENGRTMLAEHAENPKPKLS